MSSEEQKPNTSVIKIPERKERMSKQKKHLKNGQSFDKVNEILKSVNSRITMKLKKKEKEGRKQRKKRRRKTEDHHHTKGHDNQVS